MFLLPFNLTIPSIPCSLLFTQYGIVDELTDVLWTLKEIYKFSGLNPFKNPCPIVLPKAGGGNLVGWIFA